MSASWLMIAEEIKQLKADNESLRKENAELSKRVDELELYILKRYGE